jgi:DivIVA domain-containing protein
MDSPPVNDKANGQKANAKPSIDSLRTVEFRTTIRGYHMDDVDEYLERVAVEAEELQEQMRLSADRMKQALERVSSLEAQLEQARRAQAQAAQQSVSAPQPQVERISEAPADDSLQRTLLLAQKFVDQTRTEAEIEARSLVSEAEVRARNIVGDAEEHVRAMTEDAERNLRDEVKRLDSHRTELVADVETIARHLEVERSRIRTALTEMLAWVDEHVQPPQSGAPSTASSASSASSASETDKGGSASRNPFPGGERAEAPPSFERKTEKQDSGGAPVRDDAPIADRFGGDRLGGSPTEQRSPSSGAGILAGSSRAQSEDPGYVGPPTELIHTSSGSDSDDSQGSSASFASTGKTETAGEDRIVPDRSAPTHQRQMFAPGRDTQQAETGAR